MTHDIHLFLWFCVLSIRNYFFTAHLQVNSLCFSKRSFRHRISQDSEKFTSKEQEACVKNQQCEKITSSRLKRDYTWRLLQPIVFSTIHLLEPVSSDCIHFLSSLNHCNATEYIHVFYQFCSKIEVILVGRACAGSVGVSLSHSSVWC